MGWDQLADFLGGALWGTAGGLLAGLVVAWRLTPKARVLGAVLALLGAASMFAYLSVTPASIRGSTTVAPAPVASFSPQPGTG